MYIKIDGVYRYGVPFFKVGGVWQALWGGGMDISGDRDHDYSGKEYVKVNGIWKNNYNKTDREVIVLNYPMLNTDEPDGSGVISMYVKNTSETQFPAATKNEYLSCIERNTFTLNSDGTITINRDGSYYFIAIASQIGLLNEHRDKNVTCTVRVYANGSVLGTHSDTEADYIYGAVKIRAMIKAGTKINKCTVQLNKVRSGTGTALKLDFRISRHTYD